jgi:hypothetical protein
VADTVATKIVPHRSEVEMLNECLLENKNIVFTKKDNSFILFTKMLPQTSTTITATPLTTTTTALPVIPAPTSVISSTHQPVTGDTTFVFEECGNEKN